MSSKSSSSNYSSESKFPVAIVVPAIVGGLLLIALIVLICCCCRRRKLSRDQAVNAPSAPSTDDNLTKHENKKIVSPSPNSQSAQNIIAYPELDHNYHNLPSNQQYLQQGHPYPIKGKGETNYVVHDYPEIV